MRIGIDISQIVFSGTGVATYTRNLVENLLRIDKKNEYVLFGSSLRQVRALQSFVTAVTGSDPVNGAQTSSKVWRLPPTMLDVLWNRLHVLPIESFTGELDIFHSSDWTQPPTKAKKVTTIHDLVVYKYPENLHPRIVTVQRRRLEWVKKECDLIIVVSRNTKKDIMEILKIPEEKIRIIYEAAGPQYQELSIKNQVLRVKEIRRIQEKYGLHNEYILAVGTREPRKNLDRLVEAFQTLKLKDTDLVIAGKYGWEEQKIKDPFGLAQGGQRPKIKNNIKTIGLVPPSDLPGMYAGAKVFVYPSLYEGFGLPVLEAMNCGCPVITSNVSSLPEVGGDAAVYVDPLNVDDIALKLLRLLKLPKKERDNLIQKGFRQAAKFSWEKAARETLAVYEELL